MCYLRSNQRWRHRCNFAAARLSRKRGFASNLHEDTEINHLAHDIPALSLEAYASKLDCKCWRHAGKVLFPYSPRTTYLASLFQWILHVSVMTMKIWTQPEGLQASQALLPLLPAKCILFSGFFRAATVLLVHGSAEGIEWAVKCWAMDTSEQGEFATFLSGVSSS